MHGRKAWKIVGWVALAVGGIAVVAALVLVWAVRRPFPRERGRVAVPGIENQVEVYRDEFGVAHIYGRSAEDVYFAQGYVHAQDRFWQMEFWRRLSAGRLSEYFGETTVGTDRYIRTMGFSEIAEAEYALLSERERRWLEAYAAGVNEYTSSRPPAALGLEFALLSVQGVDIDIEPWRPADTLRWVKIMAIDLSAMAWVEVANLTRLRTGGTALQSLLQPSYRDGMPYIVDADELEEQRLRLGLPPLPAQTVPPRTPTAHGGYTGGSNSWAVGPALSATGAPIVANDAHLAVQIPSIWYQVGLHVRHDGNWESAPDAPGAASGAGDEFSVRGYGFAGSPGIILGQNSKVAWALTNTRADPQDYVVERIDPADPNRYWDEGGWVPMSVRVEEILVNGRDEPIRHIVRSTGRGPVMTDLESLDRWASFAVSDDAAFPDNVELSELSLRWTALEPGTIFRSVMNVNRARTAMEVREALRDWDSPGQNLVFADNAGTIGYQTAGRYPIRGGPGIFVPASSAAVDRQWQGMIPFEDMPFLIDPRDDYIVTANNAIIGPGYPYPLGSGFVHGFRARRITDELVRFGGNITVADVQALQTDVYDAQAAEMLPLLDDLDLASAYDEYLASTENDTETGVADLDFLGDALSFLREWDGEAAPESAGAAAWGYVSLHLIEETFRDETPDHRWPFGAPEDYLEAIRRLEPDAAFWDDRTTPDRRELRSDIIGRAVVRGLLEAREELGDDPSRWRWQDVLTVEFRHATLGESGIGIVERLFNRGPFGSAGGGVTVNVAGWGLDDAFSVQGIASQRAVYDLSDPANSRFMDSVGQSGHPFHRHYGDLIEPWREGRFHPANWTRGEVEASAGARRLLLQPVAEE